MPKNYSSIVSPINRELDWGYTDAEVVSCIKTRGLVVEDANYHHVCKQLRPDDFMTALKDTMYVELNKQEADIICKILKARKPDTVAEEEMVNGVVDKIKSEPGIDDAVIIDMAAEVFIRIAITRAADKALYDLQSLLGIDDGGFHPGTALHIDEHVNTLVKDYCDIFSGQRMNVRM